MTFKYICSIFLAVGVLPEIEVVGEQGTEVNKDYWMSVNRDQAFPKGFESKIYGLI